MAHRLMTTEESSSCDSTAACMYKAYWLLHIVQFMSQPHVTACQGCGGKGNQHVALLMACARMHSRLLAVDVLADESMSCSWAGPSSATRARKALTERCCKPALLVGGPSRKKEEWYALLQCLWHAASKAAHVVACKSWHSFTAFQKPYRSNMVLLYEFLSE